MNHCGSGLAREDGRTADQHPEPEIKKPRSTRPGLFRFYSPPSVTQIRFMNRLVAMGSPLVLRRPDSLVPAQIIIGMQRPIRITQQFPGEEDDVGLTGTQNMLGLGRFGDHSYSASGNA